MPATPSQGFLCYTKIFAMQARHSHFSHFVMKELHDALHMITLQRIWHPSWHGYGSIVLIAAVAALYQEALLTIFLQCM